MQPKKLIIVLSIVVIVFLILAGNNNQVHEVVQQYVENGEIATLESRYSPEQIMRLHEEALLPNKKYTFEKPTVIYQPYLYMDVKYTQSNGKTKEGTILWSLVDGEMVIDADTWEKTHGFRDAILANANANDMIILNMISHQKDGKMSLSQLQKALNIEQTVLDKIIQQAKDKYLITQRGNIVSLHFENPMIHVIPMTHINQKLVTKPSHHANRVERKFNRNQIEKISKAAFGKDFAIRSTQEVYLPVYHIEVLNPDGTKLSSYWNALTGREST